jgi:hypothetical protein
VFACRFRGEIECSRTNIYERRLEKTPRAMAKENVKHLRELGAYVSILGSDNDRGIGILINYVSQSICNVNLEGMKRVNN